MTLPNDYLERVYAGVLGKIIGVYIGRPFEGWSYQRIMDELGEINYYVHEKRGVPLIVTDDDISGTFTFLRALPDYDNSLDLTPAQIGQTWLNYLIEKRTVLWWGGVGTSTEHTAYQRLKEGIQPPLSGSMHTNSQVVAEQIGAQIFIDGWALVAPGNPELAIDLAQRAASVSHDGEAIYGAQVIAALESLAFVESDWDSLLDQAVSFIPSDSVIYQMIADIRRWRTTEPDWRKAFALLAENYGYDKYGGGCHMVPNHGLIILSLLYGDDDFQKTMMIVNTCGWDTDCNSGNAGCIIGIKNGLAGLETGPDYREPVADRLYLPTADGGSAVTDAVREALAIANIGCALVGQPPLALKNGARFNFDLPGAVQGWHPENSIESKGTVTVENVTGHSAIGSRALAVRYRHIARGRPARVATATFIPEEAANMPGYGLLSSPTLYPGQTVCALLTADAENAAPVNCRLYLRAYGSDDRLFRVYGPQAVLEPGAEHAFEWTIDSTNGAPIAEIGVEMASEKRSDGMVYLDYLTWDGLPDVLLTRPKGGGSMWQRAWVDGVDYFGSWDAEPYRLIQNEGMGLLIQGTREWTDYRLNADVRPHMVQSAGIAVRVQGMRRYYALLLCRDRKARLVKALDGNTVLAEKEFDWAFDQRHDLSLKVVGTILRAWIDGNLVFELQDTERPLLGGSVALLCEGGRTVTNLVSVHPT